MRRFSSYIAAFVTILFWSSAYPAVKYALSYYSPESIMLLRFIVASITLGIYCMVKKVKPPLKKDIRLFLVAGLVGIFSYMWLFNSGTKFVTSGISSFIIASSPIFTLILSILFLKEKASFMSILGMCISLSGLILVAYTQATDVSINMGTVLLILAAICNGIYVIFQRKILTKYTAIQGTFFCVLIATVCMFVFFPNLSAEFSNVPPMVNLIVVYLGIFPAAIAYLLWGYSLSKVKNTIQTTSFMYLSPFISTVLGYFWLKETVPILSFVGGAVIIIGLVVTNLLIKKQKKAINLLTK